MISLLRSLYAAGLLTLHPVRLVQIVRCVRAHGFRPSGMAAVAALRFPDQVAVVDDAGSITYRDLDRRARSLATALADRHGIGPDRALGIMCRNHRGFVEALIAGSSLGADLVLLNTEFPGPQLAQVLAHHRLGAVVHDEAFGEAFAEAFLQAPRVPQVIGARGIDALVADAGDRPPPASRRRGQITILTSGTTGAPKGAARRPTFRALSGPLATLLDKIPLRTRITLLVAPPLFHGFGLAYLALALLLGATLVLRRRFDPAQALADIDANGVDIVVAVPTMLRRLIEALPEAGDPPPIRAVLSAGSPLGAGLGARFAAAFGPCLYNLYGSSETGFGAIATPADLAAAPGTVGFPPVGTEIRLIDEAGRDSEAGAIGRVFVRSGLVFSGYTGGGSKDVVDGFMASGDLGHIDEAGRLFIDGRSDDMIVSGGENVFPLEVEEILAARDDIAEVAVVGVDDDEFGQRLAAYVVRRGEASVEAEALSAFLKARIARYKLPRDFFFLPALPRTATGKLIKRDLPAPWITARASRCAGTPRGPDRSPRRR